MSCCRTLDEEDAKKEGGPGEDGDTVLEKCAARPVIDGYHPATSGTRCGLYGPTLGTVGGNLVHLP